MRAYIALLLLPGVIAAGPASARTPVPCEKMLREVQDALNSGSLAADVKAQATALQDKGIERCKADDDVRANGFFADALKLMGR
jgi:hypothetical protein